MALFKKNSDHDPLPEAGALRRKQILIFAGGLVALGVIAFGALTLTAPSAPPPSGPVKSVKLNTLQGPGQNVTAQDVWLTHGAKEQVQIREALRELQGENAKLVAQMQALQADRGPSERAPLFPPPVSIPRATASTQAPLLPPPGMPPAGAMLAPPRFATELGSRESQRAQALPNEPSTVSAPGVGIMRVVVADKREAPATPTVGRDEGARADSSGVDAAPREESRRQVGTWLPAGSFSQAILLSGLDAPTGGQAQSNPHPVLLELQGYSQLPNRFRARTKECRVVGAAHGDISSERAYIRTEKLVCVMKSGEVIEKPFHGYVAGEDGKAGLRGRLVTKEGQILGRALLAGLLSGVSSGLTAQTTTTAVSPLGTTQTIDAGKIFEHGAYAGTGKAMDQLAKYYISQLDKTFPVIEVDAARRVDVVILSGVDLEGDINQLAETQGTSW